MTRQRATAERRDATFTLRHPESWDGYHLYEYSQANHLVPQTPDGLCWPGRPWWTGRFAPATDSRHVIASTPFPDFTVVARGKSVLSAPPFTPALSAASLTMPLMLLTLAFTRGRYAICSFPSFPSLPPSSPGRRPLT